MGGFRNVGSVTYKYGVMKGDLSGLFVVFSLCCGVIINRTRVQSIPMSLSLYPCLSPHVCLWVPAYRADESFFRIGRTPERNGMFSDRANSLHSQEAEFG